MSNSNLAGSSLGAYLPQGLMEWGPILGGLAASGGAVATRMFAPPGSWFARNSEVTGVLVSGAVAGALAISPSTRSAAVLAFLGGVAAALPRIVESWMTQAAPVAGMGYYAAEGPNPALLGMVRADQINGLGYATAQPQPHAYGTVPGVAGAFAGPIADTHSGPPVNLLGPATGHMSLAKHFGATHMGGN